MRPEAFECVDMASSNGALPLRSSQRFSVSSSRVRLILLAGLAAAVGGPQLVLAGYALASAEIRAAILSRPVVAFELAAAMVFWIGLFALPLMALLQRLAWRRDVEITSRDVAVSDSRSFGGGAWTAPLASYTGVAHHLRTSLSGTRHEMVLEHPDSARSVLLMVTEHISEADVARMSRLLGLPPVPARELYRLRGCKDLATKAALLVSVAA